MKFSFNIQVNSTPANIWKFYECLENWYIWEEDLKDIQLEGEFKTGTKGYMVLDAIPKIDFELTYVEKYKSFCDKTYIPNLGELYFNHEILLIDGVYHVKHSVELKTEVITFDKVKFLENIFKDMSSSVYKLKEASENGQFSI